MRLQYTSHRIGPLMILSLISFVALLLVFLIPLLGGFLLLATASTVLGWLLLNVKKIASQNLFSNPIKKPDRKTKTSEIHRQSEIIIIDKDDSVIRIEN